MTSTSASPAIRIAKWVPNIDYKALKYPHLEYQDGIDLGDVSKSAFVLFSIDLDPPALTMNLWHDSTDQGIIQNSLEWELPPFDQDKDAVLIHLLLLNLATVIYPNGFEKMEDNEMLRRLTKLLTIIESLQNPKMKELLDKDA